MSRLMGGLMARTMWAPDDGTGEGAPVEAPVAETPAAEPAVESAPVEQAAPPVPSEPAFDYRAAYEQAQAQQAQMMDYMRQMQENWSREQSGVREILQRTFDPEGYRRAQQPQYVSRQDLQQMRQDMMREFQQQSMAQQLRAELPMLKEKFGKLYEVFGDNAEDVLVSNWINSKKNYRSVLDVANDMNAALERYSQNSQKAWAAQKTATRQQLKGASGPAGSNTQAPTATPERKAGGGFGRERFSEITEEMLADVLRQ